MGEKLSLANKGKEVTSVSMSKSLSLHYKFHTQKIIITSLFYKQKIMIAIIIPV